MGSSVKINRDPPGNQWSLSRSDTEASTPKGDRTGKHESSTRHWSFPTRWTPYSPWSVNSRILRRN